MEPTKIGFYSSISCPLALGNQKVNCQPFSEMEEIKDNPFSFFCYAPHISIITKQVKFENSNQFEQYFSKCKDIC